tara:strand:+ start:137 stop:832 length:696 start_codon:yes stop_codon:yes gene_type:complete
MKKMLSVLIIAMLPSYAFALIGFGLQFGSDLSKLGPQSYTEGSGDLAFNVNSYEMKSNPVGGGGYAFVDLFGFALEGEFDFAFGEYEFDFGNQYMDFDPIPFGWARASYAATLKKNIMDLSIPFLAKAAVNVGGGFGGHVSTPRANVEMVRELFGDDLINLNVNSEDLEDNLVSYLKDNAIEESGLHLQAGLRFKVLVLDTHLNARYNLAKNVYDGKNGFLQLMFKMGFAF